MNKPLIAVMPLYDSDKKSYWMLPGYMKGIEISDGIPIMLPLTTDMDTLDRISNEFDGFLFTGGQDVGPGLYGEETLPCCGEICKERDIMEKYLLERIIELDKPALGICRGIQIFNAALGGTLYQDLNKQHPSDTEHHMSAPYDRAVHSVRICSGTPLSKIINADIIGVNSYHHQAIKELSPQLKAMAISEDGLIEGVYMPDKTFILALQWHPEFSFRSDTNSLEIFRNFVKACGGRNDK